MSLLVWGNKWKVKSWEIQSVNLSQVVVDSGWNNFVWGTDLYQNIDINALNNNVNNIKNNDIPNLQTNKLNISVFNNEKNILNNSINTLNNDINLINNDINDILTKNISYDNFINTEINNL